MTIIDNERLLCASPPRRQADEASLEDLTDDELARAIELSFGSLVVNEGGGPGAGGVGGSSSAGGVQKR